MTHHPDCFHRSGAIPAGVPCPCADLEAALKLAYIGEHRFPDNTYKARLDELVPRMREMERVIDAFADTAERAVANSRRQKGGMQVPYLDDFANIAPSTVARLEWWAKRMREALK